MNEILFHDPRGRPMPVRLVPAPELADRLEALTYEVVRLARELDDETASRLFVQECLERVVERLANRIKVLEERR